MLTAMEYRTEHTGWLLASLSPANVAKGRRQLGKLPQANQHEAEIHARHLVSLYAGQSTEAAASYAGHDYAA